MKERKRKKKARIFWEVSASAIQRNEHPCQKISYQLIDSNWFSNGLLDVNRLYLNLNISKQRNGNVRKRSQISSGVSVDTYRANFIKVKNPCWRVIKIIV